MTWSKSNVTSAIHLFYLRNEFHSCVVHRSMNAMGLVQSKLTLHRTHCVHTSINNRKMKFNSCIYTLFFNRFCSTFVKFWWKSCKISGEEKLYADVFGHYVQQPSSWHALIERYVGQSSIAFIRDVAYAWRRMNECRSSMYEPRRSKIG